MEKEIKEIFDRPLDEMGSLDRLVDYAQANRVPLGSAVCDTNKGGDCPEDDTCEGCAGFEGMSQIEYAMQTEIILFSEKLIADWKAGSIY